MIRTVRNKVSTAPEDNYSIAVCDRCEAECIGSRQPGQIGNKGRDAAIEVAKASPGWTEKFTPIRSSRKRAAWTVELLCPNCSEPPNVTVIENDGETD